MRPVDKSESHSKPSIVSDRPPPESQWIQDAARGVARKTAWRKVISQDALRTAPFALWRAQLNQPALGITSGLDALKSDTWHSSRLPRLCPGSGVERNGRVINYRRLSRRKRLNLSNVYHARLSQDLDTPAPSPWLAVPWSNAGDGHRRNALKTAQDAI